MSSGGRFNLISIADLEVVRVVSVILRFLNLNEFQFVCYSLAFRSLCDFSIGYHRSYERVVDPHEYFLFFHLSIFDEYHL